MTDKLPHGNAEGKETKPEKTISQQMVAWLLTAIVQLPTLWLIGASILVVLSMFDITRGSNGGVTVAFHLSNITALFLALIWLPALLKVLLLIGFNVKTPLGDISGAGVLGMHDLAEPRRVEEVKELPEAMPTGEAEKAYPSTRYPPDYLFLNHTAFFRPEQQAEFKATTRAYAYDHYDIQVIVDSYYAGALDKVERVRYILHPSYPEGHRIQERTAKDREMKFLLKDVANGEFVLKAEVFLRGEAMPIVLQRYITLWSSGPRIDRYLKDFR